MINKEVYVEVHLLKKHGFSLRQIAQEVGCAVNTVRRQLKADRPLNYERRVKAPSKLAAFETYLRERQQAAKPLWIPATVLLREIVQRGYSGKASQLRAFMRTLKPQQLPEPLIRYETQPGEQMQVDWVEFRKGRQPLYAFCATLGYSRASYVQFVGDMKVQTLIECHERCFEAFGGVPRKILYDNMKTVVLERDSYGQGQHRYHAGFLDYAGHSGFIIKLCRPYRAKTKGKVERFNGYLRRSFYAPLSSRLSQGGLKLDVVTANIEVAQWLCQVANQRVHGATDMRPWVRLQEELPHLQAMAAPWRGDIAAARPQAPGATSAPLGANLPMTGMPAPIELLPDAARVAAVQAHIGQTTPAQHPLAVYEQLLMARIGQDNWRHPQATQGRADQGVRP